MYRFMASICVSTLILTASAISAAPKTKSPPAIKHDAAVEAELRARFKRYDFDKDGFLDATEVAKAYRGSAAKPAPEAGYDSKGNFVAPATSKGFKYPDQVFMLAADKNGDRRVSWDEYDVYGESIVLNAKNQQQAMRAAYAAAQRNNAARRNRTYSRNGRSYHRPVARHGHIARRR